MQDIILIILPTFMRWVVAMLLVGNTYGLVPQNVIFVRPGAEARTPLYELKARDALRLSVESPKEAVLHAYIYDIAKNLVGMDDPETDASTFEWTAPLQGQYYVVVTNSGSGAGAFRMTVDHAKSIGPTAEVPNYSVMRVFYATDRQRTVSATPDQYYSGEPNPSGGIAYGICRVTVPRPVHQMGELEGPSIFKLEFRQDPNKHIVLEAIEPERVPTAFFDKVRERVNLSKQHEAFVFVHGYNTSFADAARRAAQIGYDLGFDGAPILFSWSSLGSTFSYTRDSRNADLGAIALETFLRELGSQGIKTVHIICHSMGGRVVSKALDSIGKDAAEPRFKQVALIAPDIDADLFKTMAKSIKTSAERVTLYASSRDLAMEGSGFLSGAPRAGDSTGGPLVLPGLVDSIDASNVDTSSLGLGHQYYADNQTILSDLFYLIRGAPLPRFRLAPVGAYWIFQKTAR